MKRNDFLKEGMKKVGTIVGIPVVFSSCKKNDLNTTSDTNGDCKLSPSETKGPFPIKTPSQLVQANIKSDRSGVALLINLTIVNAKNNCTPIANCLVDVWHCDKDGYYSEYGGTGMQQADFTNSHFLRGRQSTDSNGNVSFISIYPGWYSGRAPHIHIEILSSSGTSLLVTQIAFPENINSLVYASNLYAAKGQADTSNTRDNIFSDSIAQNLATVTGNVTDGFTVTKTIVVNA